MSKTFDFTHILKCPECAASMETLVCAHCGYQPSMENGVPGFPFGTRRETYSASLIPLPEIEQTLATCFQNHGKGQTGDTYHLDGVHDAILRGLPRESIVFEIGCGGGQMRSYVNRLGLAYVGTDISQTNVQEDLRIHGGPDFVSDAHLLPVKDASVDVIYSAAVSQYLAAPVRGFQEMFRVLKPGGYFLGNCAYMEPWTDGSFFHTTPNGAASLLISADFSIQSMWPSYKYSGYQALLASGSRTARLINFLGTPMRVFADLTYTAKRLIRGTAYSDHSYAVDLARTAGGIDWVARKP